ncbi:MAG: hypothetical protein JWO07_815, partial [Candidatus Saccharibacteria bacterium]|nr:hypothetical protein [Candidatus Saccharibacteria bacterium]
MMSGKEKMVLSGGAYSEITVAAAIDLSGSSKPQLLIDTSPKENKAKRDASRSALTKWFDQNYRSVTPEFLHLEDPNEPITAIGDKLESADVLMVTGGGTMQGLDRWQRLGVADQIRRRVQAGQMAIHGASAGAMIWFEQGYSDSLSTVNPRDWQYIVTPGMGVVPAWIMAHHEDSDELGREKSTQFRQALSDNEGRWSHALGIETGAALVCSEGLGYVLAASKSTRYPSDVILYTPNPG